MHQLSRFSVVFYFKGVCVGKTMAETDEIKCKETKADYFSPPTWKNAQATLKNV